MQRAEAGSPADEAVMGHDPFSSSSAKVKGLMTCRNQCPTRICASSRLDAVGFLLRWLEWKLHFEEVRKQLQKSSRFGRSFHSYDRGSPRYWARNNQPHM